MIKDNEAQRHGVKIVVDKATFDHKVGETQCPQKIGVITITNESNEDEVTYTLTRGHDLEGATDVNKTTGTLKKGELAPDIEEAILRLQPGEASTPFRSQVGYHLFRLDSRESLAGEALGQVRNQIRDILYRQKYDARLKEWLVEIKQRAIIDIRM
jgi:hypothetical protein